MTHNHIADCQNCGKKFKANPPKFCSRECYEIGRPRRPALERFWEKVDKERKTGCWNWTAAKNNGYGWFGHRQGQANSGPAHRWAYEQFVGEIPAGLELDHLCRNRSCVNPAHLEPVTSKENSLRGFSPAAINARKTHCVHGHELTPENVWLSKLNQRRCKKCNAIWTRKFRDRKNEGVI